MPVTDKTPANRLSKNALARIPKPTQKLIDKALAMTPKEREEAKTGQNLATGGLTWKQENFARFVARGSNYSDAYRGAYNCENMSAEIIWTRASELANHRTVKVRIAELIEAANKQIGHEPAVLRRKALQKILDIMDNPSAKLELQIKAAELLGKVGDVGLFRDVIPEPAKDSVDADVNTLASRIKALIRTQVSDNAAQSSYDTKEHADVPDTQSQPDGQLIPDTV